MTGETPAQESGPETWPLLSLLGSRAVLYESGQALTHRFAPLNFQDRIKLLEDGEERLARGKPVTPDEFHWHPGDAGLARFLTHCRERALATGGLRLHALLGDDIPLEALPASKDGNAGAQGDPAIIRLTEIAFEKYLGHPAAPAPAIGETPDPPRVLIYFNPHEEPELPAAREESRVLAEKLDGRCDDRYIARALDETEWRGHLEWADVVFYFGHGRNISGAPAIPSPSGWMPFGPAGVALARKAFFFSACYRGPAAGTRVPGGCALFPLCRLADRPAPFLGDLVDNWLSGAELWRAYRHAVEQDARVGDMRRFVFQLQGLNAIASRAGLFG